MLDVCVRNINCTLTPHEGKDLFFWRGVFTCYSSAGLIPNVQGGRGSFSPHSEFPLETEPGALSSAILSVISMLCKSID